MENNEQSSEYCAKSQRVDGKLHSWRFDGDDPYTLCVYCNERRDALSGQTIRPSNGLTYPDSAITDIKQRAVKAERARLREAVEDKRWDVFKGNDPFVDGYNEAIDVVLKLLSEEAEL